MSSSTPFDRMALRRSRTAAGLTQHQLAVAIDVAGTTRISEWEGGRATPTIVLVGRLAAALNVSVESLLWPEGDNPGDLRSLRLVRGLTALDVARAAGMSRTSYLNLESGATRRMPPDHALVLLASVLGVGVKSLKTAIQRSGVGAG